ncbi:uncharacterized protein APUU_50841A [Aspergillus puulaauensis]|uniref:Uncharacterized protein n=1 Tax=Aspergillus puulaauensis TaxID=1220207 RepID=A0A7R7XR27_9EURO|nr:uncharacterized protein APUU_50841A [Aspergillus puulaauensis]BCS26130.1 hypothetical protein APUU_50841A [Aspergillus puulaauensis]
MNPNVNLNESESFTEHFNENVDYTRDKAQATSEDIGMDIGQDQNQRGENLAQTQADAQAQTGSGMNTGGTGAFGSDNQRATEAQTSIDSTNAGVDHRRTSYSFTADTLAHPDYRYKTGPEE